tara:strand:+ start:428 stop:661 length:234 start_codon:yes stop_codon:yes gene_type:complete
MLSGKLLRQILDKMLTNSTVAKDARVQIVDPKGRFYDVTQIRLAENKLIGVRESHRIIMTITEEKGWKMGKVVKLKD